MQKRQTGAAHGNLGCVLLVKSGIWCPRLGQTRPSAAGARDGAVLCYIVSCSESGVLYVLCVLQLKVFSQHLARARHQTDSGATPIRGGSLRSHAHQSRLAQCLESRSRQHRSPGAPAGAAWGPFTQIKNGMKSSRSYLQLPFSLWSRPFHSSTKCSQLCLPCPCIPFSHAMGILTS